MREHRQGIHPLVPTAREIVQFRTAQAVFVECASRAFQFRRVHCARIVLDVRGQSDDDAVIKPHTPGAIANRGEALEQRREFLRDDMHVRAGVKSLGVGEVIPAIPGKGVLIGDADMSARDVAAADLPIPHERLPHVQHDDHFSGMRIDVLDGLDEIIPKTRRLQLRIVVIRNEVIEPRRLIERDLKKNRLSEFMHRRVLHRRTLDACKPLLLRRARRETHDVTVRCVPSDITEFQPGVRRPLRV